MFKEMDAHICPACKKCSSNHFADKNGHSLYGCDNCGSIFIYPVPENCADIYQENYFCGTAGFGYADYDGDKDILLINFNKYLDKLDKFIPKSGKLLDVGAATGTFVGLANERGWIAKGIEISKNAVAIGQKKKLDIVEGDLGVYDFQDEFFDVVTLWDVLEHFSDPDSTIVKIFEIIKKDGLLAINTPNSSSVVAKILGKRWHLLIPPEHVNCFSLKGLEIMLNRNNFELLYVGRVGKRFSLRYIFKTLANWQGLSVWKKISDYLHGSPFGDFNMEINTRDNIFIIARKR